MQTSQPTSELGRRAARLAPLLWAIARAYAVLLGVVLFSLAVMKLSNPSSPVRDPLTAGWGVCFGVLLVLPPRILARRLLLAGVLVAAAAAGLLVGLWEARSSLADLAVQLVLGIVVPLGVVLGGIWVARGEPAEHGTT